MVPSLPLAIRSTGIQERQSPFTAMRSKELTGKSISSKSSLVPRSLVGKVTLDTLTTEWSILLERRELSTTTSLATGQRKLLPSGALPPVGSIPTTLLDGFSLLVRPSLLLFPFVAS